MPFSPIVVNTKTFNQSGDGRYMRNTVTFGSPADYFTVKGGSLNKDRANITCAITRLLEKDVTVNGVTTRKSALVQTIITSPTTGFTSAELDAMVSDNSEFVTGAILDRILSGES
jgi:hypothetical protein